jgi:hypothetical protein
MTNPLENLAAAAKESAKGAIRTGVDWAYGPQGRRNNGNSSKSDPVLGRLPLDTLRRAAFNNVFDTLFQQVDDFPYVVPDKTLKNVIKKLGDNVFPKGTVFSLEDKTANALLQDLIRQTKFQLKTENIITEAALMDWCAVRTVYDDLLDRWLLEVKPKEYITIETVPGVPDEITGVSCIWPTRTVKEGSKAVTYWKKERWTDDVYQAWPEQPQRSNEVPKFKPEDAATEDNGYGEIPYTLVPHYFDSDCVGLGVVGPEEILTVKALIRLRHKEHWGHQKYMDPNPVRTNHANPGEPIDMGIGKVIDITQADPNLPADLKLLEFAGMPDSVDKETHDHISGMYAAAGLKPPPLEGNEKAGTNVAIAGVAMRLLDTDDAKTIETLRDNGYSQVPKIFERILRMGANLGRPEFGFVNPEDSETYTVSVKYPDFFPPTDADIAQKLANYEAANLPADIIAPKIAALFGIEDPEAIRKIQAGIEDKRAAMEPTPNIGD